jgi:hypothetical protein
MITNGQFKGAMLTVGFVPKDEYAFNWQFHIGPRWKVRSARGERLHVHTYSLARFDKLFTGLLLKAEHLEVGA